MPALTETWTLFPGGMPQTVRCAISRIELADGRPALQVEALHDVASDADLLRTVEAMRHTPVMVSVFDEGGRLLTRNPAAADVFRGLPEPLSTHFSVAADGDALWRECQRAGAARGELTVPTRDGEHWHAVHLQRTVDPAEGGPMLVLSETDISTRKATEHRLQRAEEQFRALVEQALAGIYILQDNGFCYVNPRFAEIFGYTQREAQACTVDDFVHPDDRTLVQENIRRRLEGEVEDLHYRFRGIRRDGTLIHVHVHGTRTEHDGRPAILGVLLDVTEQHASEQALRASEQRLREITGQLPTGLFVSDLRGRLTFMNPAAEALLGWREEELIGHDVHAAFHQSAPDGAVLAVDDCPVVRATREGRVFEHHADHFRHKDGTWVPVAIKAAPLRHDGAVIGAVTHFHDISERLEYQRALEEEEERYRMLFNSGKDALLVTTVDGDGRLQPFSEINHVACEWLGYGRDELLALTPYDLDAPENTPPVAELVEGLIADRAVLAERMLVTRSGERLPVELNLHLFEFKGRRMLFANARDIRERKEAEARIHRLAHYDHLTGLPNRLLLAERMDQALAQAQRHRRQLAVLFIDLDGFKPINDRYGHDTGDELLQLIAGRLHDSVREGDTVCRWSGDEFILVLSEIADGADAERVATKVLEAVARPAVLSTAEVRVSASIGIALYPEDATDRDGLVTRADGAMYEAKHGGKDNYRRAGPGD